MVAQAVALAQEEAPPVRTRIKDIAKVRGSRDNPLQGLGLVVGLNGTGDGDDVLTSTKYSHLLARSFKTDLKPKDLESKNLAVVMVTAVLPPYAHEGDALDVTVASPGNASRLEGGVLLTTPLKGPDDRVYAVAQGPVVDASAATHATVGRIPRGATVERELETVMAGEDDYVYLVLEQPDFTTAVQVSEAINRDRRRLVGLGGPVGDEWEDEGVLALPKDAGTVMVKVPPYYRDDFRLTEFIAKVEQIPVTVVDSEARVVINQRTKTVVITGDVVVQPVAITHGTLQLSIVDGTLLADLVRDLRALGVGPDDLIQMIQVIARAGKLNARLVVM
ncbi:MAG: flagellar basal body P-ring protein FlgI [Planctomycetes bacterium]|nr:flagellar basal body P-ring protein FlgI [Planctomycetota bacterium]